MAKVIDLRAYREQRAQRWRKELGMKSWFAWLASAFGMIIEMIYQAAQKKPPVALEPTPADHKAELGRKVAERRREKFGK